MTVDNMVDYASQPGAAIPFCPACGARGEAWRYADVDKGTIEAQAGAEKLARFVSEHMERCAPMSHN
jgi:hypothetical protein